MKAPAVKSRVLLAVSMTTVLAVSACSSAVGPSDDFATTSASSMPASPRPATPPSAPRTQSADSNVLAAVKSLADALFAMTSALDRLQATSTSLRPYVTDVNNELQALRTTMSAMRSDASASVVSCAALDSGKASLETDLGQVRAAVAAADARRRSITPLVTALDAARAVVVSRGVVLQRAVAEASATPPSGLSPTQLATTLSDEAQQRSSVLAALDADQQRIGAAAVKAEQVADQGVALAVRKCG